MVEPQVKLENFMPEIHLQDYLPVILRRRWIIVTFFTVLVVMVSIGSLMQTPIYEAVATIMIEQKSPSVVSFKEVISMGAGDYSAYKDFYETQYKLLVSHTLLKKVANSLGFRSVDSAGKYIDQAKRLQNVIKIEPVKNSQLVKIKVESVSPQMAEEIANAVAGEFIRHNLERSINTANEASLWLTKSIDDQGKKLRDLELALQKYRIEHNINIMPETNTEEAVEGIKANYASLQALLASYSERYTDDHPKMVELKAQIGSLRNKIQGLEDTNLSDKSIDYRVLEREVQINKHMYESLLTRLKEVSLSSTLSLSNISVVDRAEIPLKPIKPKVVQNILLAIIAGLFGGVSLAFFIDYLDLTIKSPMDIRGLMESRFLGGVLEIEGDAEIDKDRIMHLKPTSPEAESYRHIRTEILSLLTKEGNLKSIVITSAESQAGKTMTGANISISLAQNGHKVLFVDADLRKPQLHKVFNLEKHNGLGDYLGQNADSGPIFLSQIIQDPGIENLKIITSGTRVNSPAELIGSRKMVDLIAEAKQVFDYVIFDSPPVISVTDAVILSEISDAVIQVVRSGRILAPVAIKVKDKLVNTKAKFLGVVLNDLKAEHSDYGYYHYYKYYHHYGEDGQEKKPPKQKESLKGRLISMVKDKRG